MDLASQLAPFRQRVIDRLQVALPPEETEPQRLYAAMRYGAASPGKCVRGCWVYASGQTLGIPLERLDRIACAMELIHAYSLVHDDLPYMDDDDFRRGKPSCHKAFDEVTALLAGNGILTCAIQEIATDETMSDSERNAIIQHIVQTVLSLLAGQQMDIELLNVKDCNIDTLENIYRQKTGCLIFSSIMLPTQLASLDDATQAALKTYALNVSLAFQVRDDLEDIEQDEDEDRPTYPALIGREATCKFLRGLGEDALKAIENFGDQAELLRTMGTWVAIDPVSN